MAWNDYITAVNGGDTGTYDPSAAGLSGGSESALTEPILSQLIRAGFLKNGISGPPPESARINAALPPPPIPSREDLASFAPPQQPQSAAPNLMPGGGGMPRVLAQLPNAQPTPAPGGEMSMQQAGVNLWGQPTPGSPYANIGGGMAGRAPPQQPAQPQQPPAAPPSSQFGQRTTQFANRLDSSPLTNYAPPPSQKPGFYDNLMRFGLAAMQAGGKPGSTLLGALGEAGLSTVDASQKAGQTDIQNDLDARKVGIQGKGVVAKAWELVDTLDQRSHDRTLSVAAQMQTAQDNRELKAVIAGGNQALIQQKIDEIARHNSEVEATRNQATEDRAERTNQRYEDQRRQTQKDADTAYAKAYSEIGKDMNSIGLTLDQKQFRARQEAAMGHPESTHADIYEKKSGQLRAQAQAAIAAGKPKAGVNKMLQDYGLDPLP